MPPRPQARGYPGTLADQIAAIVGSAQGFDPNRLHQEAVLLAAKADIREESIACGPMWRLRAR
jgi:uncharacterized protein YicC (UPF0701 family)